MNTEKLNEILSRWVNDQDNETINLELAEEYRSLNQLAAAFSHYIKLYELTTNIEVKYYCAMSIAEIYYTLGCRWNGVIQHCRLAKAEMPDRPEAYYLLAEIMKDKLFNEEVNEQNEWVQVYENARIGLMYAEAGFDKPVSKFYLGIDGLKSIYALSLIKIGKIHEAKQYLLSENFENSIDYIKDQIIKLYDDLRIWCPYTSYNKSIDYNNLKIKFDGIDKINNNYSQVMQDMFVLTILNGKTSGSYLELGSADPEFGSNTKLLEGGFGWNGVSIDMNQTFCNQFSLSRKNPVQCANAFDINFYDLMTKVYKGNIIDYLSIDIDPAQNSFNILFNIPFDDYQFRCITFEHDCYAGNDWIRDESRKFFLSKGYYPVAKDVCWNTSQSFEDWWIKPELVDNNIANQLIDNINNSNSNLIKDWFINR